MLIYGKKHFKSGAIKEIEIPYASGKNATAFMAVQIIEKGEKIDADKTEQTIFSTNSVTQTTGEGTCVFKFDNLIVPNDFEYVRLAFVSNTETKPDNYGSNCLLWRTKFVEKLSGDSECKVYSMGGMQMGSGVMMRASYVKSSVLSQIHTNVTTLDSKITNHIGDTSHLTDAQKTSISQISTISSEFDSHKTNGGTLHVTADEKSKWTSHVDNDSLHVTSDFKNEISDAIDVNTVALRTHTNDEDVHFSKTEIEDVLAEIKVRDLVEGGSTPQFPEPQGIAYVQVCEPTYNFTEKSYLKSICIPQNHTRTDYTKDNVYLVIHGDKTAHDDWEYVACSINTQYQEANGEDMVFEFEQGIDLGAYKRCRFFYSLTNEDENDGEIDLPIVGSDSVVKMAFAAKYIDQNCWIMPNNGEIKHGHTFPAIISYIDGSPIASINHKDNEDRHVTPELKESISNVATVVDKV